MPRRARRFIAQCKRRKLERDTTHTSVSVDGSDDPITVGSVTPQGSVVLAASPTVIRTRSVRAAAGTSVTVPVATTTTVAAGTAIDDVEGAVISEVQQRIRLVSNIQLSKAADVPRKSLDTVVDGLLAGTMCSDCGADLGFQCTRRHAAVASLALTCGCEPNVRTCKVPTTNALDGTRSGFLSQNLAMVYSTLITGVGHAGCGVFCHAMGVSAINKRPYYNHCHFLFNNMKMLLKSGSERILKVLQSQHVDEQLSIASDVNVTADGSANRNDVAGETFLDLVVSYDGTWMTGGQKSHICVGFVIHVDTGFVLDHEVVSNYCGTCANKKASMSPQTFLAWKATHTECMQNYEGSSNSMESEAAARLWSRSQENGYRYLTSIGDGDCINYNAITGLNGDPGPYSEPVKEEESLNLVSKRLGTHLSKLKKDLRVAKEAASLHSKLRLKCLKVKHCSLARVKFAAADTVLKHNFGQYKGNLLANLNILTEDAVADLHKLDSWPGRIVTLKRRSRSVGGCEGPSDYQAGCFD